MLMFSLGRKCSVKRACKNPAVGSEAGRTGRDKGENTMGLVAQGGLGNCVCDLRMFRKYNYASKEISGMAVGSLWAGDKSVPYAWLKGIYPYVLHFLKLWL